MAEGFGEPVDRLDHRTALGHGKCAARKEVVLDVGYDKDVLITWLHDVLSFPALNVSSRI
jgi:hypothetical protein